MSGVIRLAERLNFDTLFAYSEPKRVLRSRTVRGPSLSIESYRDSMYYFFNFKSYPSTTGNRWKGYIRFMQPDDPSTPLEQVECIVDCGCPDYRYRWAWANTQRDSSQIGSASLNQCIDRAPRVTNPAARPGLCKHLLALRDFLYGQDATFPASDDTSSSARLDRLVVAARQAVIPVPERQDSDQEPGETEPAPAEQERQLTQRMQRRRRGQNPDEPPPEPSNPVNATTQSNPTTDQPRESLLPLLAVNKGMDAISEVRRMCENTAAVEPPVTAPPQTPGQQALTALQSIQQLLQQLVDFHRQPETPQLEPEPDVATMPDEPPSPPAPPTLTKPKAKPQI